MYNKLKPFYLSRDKSMSILLVQLTHNRTLSLADINKLPLSSAITRLPVTMFSIAQVYLSECNEFQLFKLLIRLCKCFWLIWVSHETKRFYIIKWQTGNWSRSMKKITIISQRTIKKAKFRIVLIFKALSGFLYLSRSLDGSVEILLHVCLLFFVSYSLLNHKTKWISPRQIKCRKTTTKTRTLTFTKTGKRLFCSWPGAEVAKFKMKNANCLVQSLMKQICSTWKFSPVAFI